MGYFRTMVMPPAQYFDCNFHAVWASVCDKSVVYFFFQAAAPVKIWTNSEHFENLDRYASVTTYIETCRAQSLYIFWPSKYLGSHFWTVQPRSSDESSLKPLFPSASNERSTYVLSPTVFEGQSDYWSLKLKMVFTTCTKPLVLEDAIAPKCCTSFEMCHFGGSKWPIDGLFPP